MTVDISHTYIGDVGLTLTAPSGNTLTLRDGGGGSEDDIVGTFPTTLTALSSMSALAGESIAGDWTLTATDSFDVDDGVINSWGLAGEVLIPDRTILGSASPNLEITSDRTAVSSIELTSLGEVSPDELEVVIDVCTLTGVIYRFRLRVRLAQALRLSRRTPMTQLTTLWVYSQIHWVR